MSASRCKMEVTTSRRSGPATMAPLEQARSSIRLGYRRCSPGGTSISWLDIPSVMNTQSDDSGVKIRLKNPALVGGNRYTNGDRGSFAIGESTRSGARPKKAEYFSLKVMSCPCVDADWQTRSRAQWALAQSAHA